LQPLLGVRQSQYDGALPTIEKTQRRSRNMQTITLISAVLLTVNGIHAQASLKGGKAAEASVNNSAALMTPEQFVALPSKPADYRSSYGNGTDQFGELRIPSGAGPHPVAILIHAGCWKAEYATLRTLAPMADALKEQGIATWNIEYRRLGQAGSGWPGSYLDVGTAVDHLRSLVARYRLDLTRVIVVGHSAGGHLALWVAARRRLPGDSPLFVKDPLHIRGVIDLAGTGDMEAFIPEEQRACQGAVVEEMLGGKPANYPERYRQVSAIRMLPLGVPQVVIWGRLDSIAPLSLGETYIQKAQRAGDTARLETSQE
jgi:acetyl esterase/lipase